MANAVPGRVGIKFCQPCLRKDTRYVADIYCEDCGEYQCKECEKIHQNFPVMSKHKLVDANTASDIPSKYDMKGLDQCKEHHKLKEFFCEDEKMPCCGKCAVVSHRKCQHVVEIEKTKELQNLDLLNIQQDYLEIEEKLKKIVRHLQRSKDNLIKDALEITDKIQTMQDKVNKIFENLKRTISKDIASFQNQAFDDFDTKTAVCDSCIDDLQQTFAEIQAVSDQGSPAQQLIMTNHFKDKGTELKTQAEKISVGLKTAILEFHIDDYLKLPPSEHATPGKLKTNFIQASELAMEISSIGMVSLQKEQKVNLKLMATIDLKKGNFPFRGNANEPLIIGLDFLPDGRLVTVDNKNKRCVVFNQNLERLTSFALSKNPLGVVVLSEDEVAITTGNAYKLIFLKISKFNEISVVRKCDVNKEFQSISLIDNDSLLVGCFHGTQPVRVVSMRGEERELYIHFPTKNYPLDSIACVYISNRNKIVISDRFAHTVYIYDKANNTRAEVKDEKIIKQPRGLVVGPFDCIFVCSEKTNSIVQMSHTGQIVYSYVLDLKYPVSVCVSKDNTRLAVSNCATGKSQLQLYNIELV